MTVITPAAVVETDLTYLDVEEADSQPHPFAAGNDVELVW